MRLNITEEDLKEGVEEVQEATKIGISKDYERLSFRFIYFQKNTLSISTLSYNFVSAPTAHPRKAMKV